MSPQQAMTEARRAHEQEGARWPIPLVLYMDQPSDDRHVFGWLCSCVGDLLDGLGLATRELKEALVFAQRQVCEETDHEAVESRAWELWLRRSAEGASFTAVAQLLFALSRGDRADRRRLAAACATPICLLESLETRNGEVLDRVIEHFSRHAAGGSV